MKELLVKVRVRDEDIPDGATQYETGIARYHADMCSEFNPYEGLHVGITWWKQNEWAWCYWDDGAKEWVSTSRGKSKNLVYGGKMEETK